MTAKREHKFFYGYIVVSAAFLILVMTWGTVYSFGVFFKPVLTEFGWTRAATSGAYSLFLLLLAFLGIVMGRLNDKFGPRIVLTGCGLVLGSGYLLMSQISAIWQLYLLYGVILAIGASGVYISLASTISRWFIKRRGLMTGIAISGIGVGTMIIPPAANWLITDYGWRVSYLVIGTAVLILIISAAQFLRYDPSQMEQLPYGRHQSEPGSVNLEARGFSLQEAIHTGQFWIISAIFFGFAVSIQTILVHIIPHATDMGISAASAANILAVIGGVSAAGRITVGGFADRIGSKLALIAVSILMTAALLWLPTAKELGAFYLFAIAFGFAYGGWATLLSLIPAELFGLGSLGVILGAVHFSVATGESIGPTLAGVVFDVTGSYQPAFLVSAALSFIAIVLTLFLKPTTYAEAHRKSIDKRSP